MRIYGPCDDSLLRMPKNVCPNCDGKDYSETHFMDAEGDYSSAEMKCNNCGHAWGWTV